MSAVLSLFLTVLCLHKNNAFYFSNTSNKILIVKLERRKLKEFLIEEVATLGIINAWEDSLKTYKVTHKRSQI